MPEISLTEFVDFVTKTTTERLSVVKACKRRRARRYDPKHDFYKKLRDGISTFHEKGRPVAFLDELCLNITDANKRKSYPEMVAAYKKFLGRKSFEWRQPKKAHYALGELTITVNPELALTINGEPHIIKMYFKEPDAEDDGKKKKLSRRQFAVLAFLMHQAIPDAGDAKIAFLDVRNSKLHVFSDLDAELQLVLEAEALSFCRMYEGT